MKLTPARRIDKRNLADANEEAAGQEKRKGPAQTVTMQKKKKVKAPESPFIVLLDICAGIGTATLACTLDKIEHVAAHSENDVPLNIFLKTKYPAAKELAPLGEIKAAELDEWINTLPRAPEAVICVAGTPCGDVAKLHANREGVHGKNSSRLFDLVKLMEELAELAHEEP